MKTETILEKEDEKLRPIVEITEVEEKEAEPILTIVESESALGGEEVVEIENDEEQEVILLPKRKRKILRYVAVAAIVPIIFYSIWIPAKTDFLETGTIQLSDFNPMAKQMERTYSDRDLALAEEEKQEFKSWNELTENLSDNVQIYNYQFTEDLYIPIILNREITENENILDVNESTNVTETEEVKVVQTNTSGLPYHVITGCFSIESNATNLVAELNSKGFSAQVLDKKNGLFRVTAGDFSERSDAKSAQSDLDSQGYSNWILKK